MNNEQKGLLVEKIDKTLTSLEQIDEMLNSISDDEMLNSISDDEKTKPLLILKIQFRSVFSDFHRIFLNYVQQLD